MAESFTAKIQELEDAKKACEKLEEKIKESQELIKEFKHIKKEPELNISLFVGDHFDDFLKQKDGYNIEKVIQIETDEEFVIIEEMLNKLILVYKKEIEKIKLKYDIA